MAEDKNVKMDKELYDRIIELRKRREMRIKYASQKQFIDIAVLALLKEEQKN